MLYVQCHKAKNLVPEAGGQPTRTGEAVLEIQVRFRNRLEHALFWSSVADPKHLNLM